MRLIATAHLTRAAARAAAGLLAVAAASAGAEDRWREIGPHAASITAVAIDPTDPRVLYAALAERGVVRSSDGGAIWGPPADGLAGKEINWLLLDPRRPTTLFAAAHSGELYRSRDGGASWEPLRLFQEQRPAWEIWGLALDAGGDRVYALTYSDRMRFLASADGGSTWTDLSTSLPPKSCTSWDQPPCWLDGMSLAADPARPGRLLMAVEEAAWPLARGIIASEDGGHTWTTLRDGQPFFRDLAIHPADSDVLYASGYSWPEPGSVWRSRDGGRTWSTIGIPAAGSAPLTADPSSPHAAFLVAPTGGGEHGRLLHTTDGGASWRPVDKGLEGWLVRDLAVSPSGLDLVAATAFGVFVSGDGGMTWRRASDGIAEAAPVAITELVADPQASGVLLAATWSHGVWRTEDGGAHWRPRNAGLGSYGVGSLVASSFDPRLLLCDTWGGTLRSADAGATWAPLPVPWGAAHAMLTTDARFRGEVYAATQEGVFWSGDDGLTWRRADGGLPIEHYRGAPQLVVDRCHPEAVFALTEVQAWGYYESRIYRSLDRGVTWLATPSNGLPRFVGNLAAAPTCPTSLWVSSAYQGVFHTADGAVSWSYQGARNDSAGSIMVAPWDPTTLIGVQNQKIGRMTAWNECFGAFEPGLEARPLLFDPHRPGVLYAVDWSSLWEGRVDDAPPLRLCSYSLPDGFVGVPYAARVPLGGGQPPFTCRLLSGAPASGLTVGPDGLVTGIPTNAGSGRFKVEATDAQGGHLAEELGMWVWVPIRVTIAATPTSGRAPLTVHLTATAQGGTGSLFLQWVFGDGGAAAGQVVTHTFRVAGAVPVTLRVTDRAGLTVEAHATISVAPPVCQLRAEPSVPARVVAGTPTTLRANVSAAGCEGGARVHWTLRNDVTSTQETFTHTFTEIGYDYWQLDVAAAGWSLTRSGSIEIVAPCAEACSAGAPQVAVVGRPVRFVGAVSPASCQGPAELLWDFGDGAGAAEASPLHVYDTPGSYSWRLQTFAQGVVCERSGSVWVTGGTDTAGSCEGAYDLVIPVAAHGAGMNGTFWQTDLDVLSLGATAATVDIALLRSGQANLTPRVATLAVPPSVALRLPDLLGNLLPAGSGALGVRVCGGKALVSAVLSTVSGAAGGACSMVVPAQPPERTVTNTRHGVFHHLTYSTDAASGFRVDIGSVSASAAPVDVLVLLVGDAGELLGTVPVRLAPFEYRQLTRVHQLVGSPAVKAGWAAVVVLTPAGAVHAYAMVIDNRSGDGYVMAPELFGE